MKFYKVTLDTPYCGTESIEYISAETKKDAEEQAEEIRSVIEAKLPGSIEVNTIYGGQPVYYYIISAE